MNHPTKMKMNLIFGIFMLMLSCNEKNNDVDYALAPEREMAMDMKTSSQTIQSPDVAVERKLIRNGQLEFKTGDVKTTKSEIEKISKELNGYISSENENNYDNRLQFMQIIRVPSDQFDNLIKRIEPLADKIENRSVNTQDVTEEFIDVEARLKTKKELEARFREILTQAKTVEEIVSIESQIANVRAEIESMEGRLKYLQNQVSFSTLNVSYYEIIGTDFGFASKLVESLKGGWDNLLSFLIFLVNLWPFVIGFATLIFWWVRRRKRQALKTK